MKKIFISSILVLLFSISLSAKDYYVKVMSISDSSYLNGAKNDIGKLGYKTYISKQGKWYMVHAGPFKDSKEAKQALSRVKKSISKDAFLTKLTVNTPKKNIKDKKTAVLLAPKKEKKKVAQKVTVEDIAPVQKKATASSVKIQEKASVPPVQAKEKKKVAQKVTVEDIALTQEKTASPQEQQKALISSVQAEEKKEPITEITQEESTSIQGKKEKGFYIALAVGQSTVDIEQSGSISTIFELEDSGINYGAEVGYYFNNNIFISINYQITDLENITLSSAFTTLNYQLDEIYSISPYIGAIAGYSTRAWEDSQIKIDDVSSFLGGLQVGSDISLYGDLSLYFYYRYLIMDTTTTIYDTSSGDSKKIEFSGEQNLNVGIKYNF